MRSQLKAVLISIIFLFPYITGFAPASPPETLKVAFISPDRNLYIWTPDRGPRKINNSGDVYDLKISGDGALIAFTRQQDDQQTSLWICNFDGLNPREVISWKDLSALKAYPDSLGAAPANMRWIPGTRTLTFTSRDIFDGPGLALNDDLVTVNGDTGNWSLFLKPGHGGMATFSPDGNWMALSTPNNISIMDVNGIPAPGPGLDFTPVITYSEYQYYPSPVWAADSSRLAVFIPTDDPMKEPRGSSAIWSMDVKGTDPVRLAQVTPQFIGPVIIAPGLDKFYYVKEFGFTAENHREIRTAKINGEDDRTVYDGGIPDDFGWTADGNEFAFKDFRTEPVNLSRVDAVAGPLAGTEGAMWFTWVDSSQYLYTKMNQDNVELSLGNKKGGSQLLAALPQSVYFQILVDFVQ